MYVIYLCNLFLFLFIGFSILNQDDELAVMGGNVAKWYKKLNMATVKKSGMTPGEFKNQ